MPGHLYTKGTKILAGDGTPIVLRGAATGGHLNMENFITGFPGHEEQHKQAMLKVMGRGKYDFFWSKFYEYFWTDQDAELFASMKLNCLRIPFNYRHFLDDTDLTKIKPEGFVLLDRVVDSCAKHGIYTILDLHAVPGGQNQDWHCDSGIHRALFWDFDYFQARIIHLWQVIADHYKDKTWVAGYNPLNEPGDPQHKRLIDFYDKVERAIREVDPHHILFLDGNTYAADFRQFPKQAYPNSVYAIHDYSNYGFPGTSQDYSNFGQKRTFERYTGTDEQKARLKSQYERKVEYMKELNVPVWNGEWGPVYASTMRNDTDVEHTNAARYHVLRDQLAVYAEGDPSGDKSPISWSIWLYKDIGYQGLTHISPTSKWYTHLRPWLDKKLTLGLDRWGRDGNIQCEVEVYKPLKEHFAKAVPEHLQRAVYPKTWSIGEYVDRVVRDILLSQYLVDEFAEYFKDLSFDELDEMAASFKLENVVVREELVTTLRESI
jgi:aryl-phospho-beta-D-glucosidase BglC (GH1 family)